jgi:hypothetical protein
VVCWARRRIAEHSLELRGEHESHLAARPPPLGINS